MTQSSVQLIVIANVRIPGERAHSVQIVRSCDALQRAGIELELLIPVRRGTGTAPPSSQELMRIYGVGRGYPCRRLPSFDLIDRLPVALQKPAFLIQSSSFSHAVQRAIGESPKAPLYLRDPHTLYFLQRGHRTPNRSVIYEAHSVPQSGAARKRFAKIAPRVDLVIALNSRIAEDLADLGIGRDRLEVVPPAATAGEPLDQAAARRRIGLDPLAQLVCYAGSLTPAKGVHTLIEAARRLPEIELLVIGGDRNQVRRARRLAGTDRIRILGHQPHADVASYLAAADVLVLPNSARDPQTELWASPMKLFEYYRCAKPIVLTDVPSLRMAVEELPGPRPLYWAEPDDPESLARGIVEALNTPPSNVNLSEPGPEDGWLERADRLTEILRPRGLLERA